MRQIKTFLEFIEVHKLIKLENEDTYGSVSVQSNSDGQVTFNIWSSKLEQIFEAPTAQGVLEAYQAALTGGKSDIELPDEPIIGTLNDGTEIQLTGNDEPIKVSFEEFDDAVRQVGITQEELDALDKIDSEDPDNRYHR